MRMSWNRFALVIFMPVLFGSAFSVCEAIAAEESGDMCDTALMPREARIKEAEEMCRATAKISNDDPHDSCHMAKLYSEGVDWELVSTVTYGAAAAACTAECFWQMPGSCDWFTAGAAGTELIGAGVMWAEGNNEVRDILSGQAGMGGAPLLLELKNPTSSTPKPGSRPRVNRTACLLAFFNTGQSALRFKKYEELQGDIETEYLKKWCEVRGKKGLNGFADSPDLASSTPSEGAGSSLSGDVSMRLGNKTMTPENAVAKTNSVFSKINEKQSAFFSEAKSKYGISGKEVMAGVLSKRGSSYGLAMASLGTRAGSSAQKASTEVEAAGKQIAKNSRADLEKMNDRYNPNASSQLFSSVSHSGTREEKKEANPLEDLSNMLGQLGAAKSPAQEENKSGGVRGVGFGSREIASTVAAKQGLSAPDRSIFETVGSRYQSVYQRFLNGETLVRSSNQNSLPRNPYLSTQEGN